MFPKPFNTYPLGPSSESVYVHCSEFDGSSQKQRCGFGQTIQRWNIGQDNEKACFDKCHNHAKGPGGGCCEYLEEGMCSFHSLGKLSEVQSHTGVIKTSICAFRYNKVISVNDNEGIGMN